MGLIPVSNGPVGQAEAHQLPDGFEALPDYGLPLAILGRPPIAANDNHLTWPFIPISGRLVWRAPLLRRLRRNTVAPETAEHFN